MPMQPSPMAETFKLFSQSLRFCIVLFFRSELTSARQQSNRRGSRLRTHYGADDFCLIAAVLGAVRSVDLVVEPEINVAEGHVFLDTACADTAFVPYLDGAKPAGGAPVHGAHAELAADPDHPNRHRLSLCAVALERRQRQFLCCSHLVELLARPRDHRGFPLSDFHWASNSAW